MQWHKLFISIDPFKEGVKNINVINFFIVSNKTVETFDIVQKNMHGHSVNKVNGVTSRHDFEVTTGMIQQNYNVIGQS